MLFSRKKIFGLDISDFSLKIVGLKKDKSNLNIDEFGSCDIPDGVIEKGRIKDQKILAKIMSNIVKSVGKGVFSGGMTICSLPEEESFIRVVQLPLMKENEVKEAIKWEIEANVPYSIDEVYYDWQLISPILKKANHTNILVAASPKEIIDGYVQTLKLAELTPLALEIESQAVVRSLIKDQKTDHPVFVLDVGTSGTGLTIFSGKTICFTSHLSFSGRDIEKAIAENCDVDLKKARELKIKIGMDKEKDENVFKALVPLVNSLIEEVERYFEFFHTQGIVEYAPDGFISKVILCGGDANLIGLPSYLSTKLKVPVERGNPWVNILKQPMNEVPELSYNKSLAYSTALGLALRGIEEKWG